MEVLLYLFNNKDKIAKKRQQCSILHIKIQKSLWMTPLALVRKDSINYLHMVGKNVLFCIDNLQHL